MGFSTVATAATTAATVLPKVFEAKSAYQQSDALKKAAEAKEREAAQQAGVMEYTASENQKRASRNATAKLGQARVDAAVSNTAQDGSTYRRGVDLATRLQDEINATANEQLEQANQVRRQGAYDAWDLRNQARQSRAAGRGALISGVGSLLAGVATGLAGTTK